MKKFLPVIFFCVFKTALLVAQPVITAADLPIAGDIFNYQQVKFAGVLPALPGPGQLWDYSGLVDSGSVRLDSFLAVGNAPNTAFYPATNLVEHSVGSTDVFNYYTTAPSSLNILGSLTPGDTTYFATPGKYLNYPFTFGSFFADSVIISLHSTGFITSAVWLDSFFVTGYGTLQLPGSVTYTGVLQVREERTFKTILGQIKTTSLIYFTPGIHAPLLIASNSNLGGTPVIEYLKNYIIIVPVKWVDFSAVVAGGQALLNWQTANEINTKLFTVERSRDAVHFEPFKSINALADVHAWSATDEQLQFGKTYYRIKHTDKEGKYSYSPVAAVNYSSKLQVAVKPNLVTNQYLNLSVNSIIATKAQVKIIGIEGKNQLARMINLATGYSQQQIDISILPKGFYLVELNAGSEKQVIKFVKQ